MKYPKLMLQINQTLARISGVLIIVIGVLSVFEAIMRSIFANPTSWSLDISTYLLIWAIFLGSSYAYQEKGHVAVDLLRDVIEKRGGNAPRKVMAIVGYIVALVVLIVLLRAGVLMANGALKLNILTTANFQIPIIYLYAAIIIGSVFMILTVIFMILDIVNGGEKFL